MVVVCADKRNLLVVRALRSLAALACRMPVAQPLADSCRVALQEAIVKAVAAHSAVALHIAAKNNTTAPLHVGGRNHMAALHVAAKSKETAALHVAA